MLYSIMQRREAAMCVTNNQANKPKYSVFNLAIMFLAINCIIVSVLTFSLATLAVITSNYDKWFPVAVILSIALFFIGRLIIRSQRRNLPNISAK